MFTQGEAGYDLWLSRFAAGTLPQSCLDKVLDVMPLRNQELHQLVGKTCVAIVCSATLPTPRTDGDTIAYMSASVDNPSDSGGANQPDTLANPTEDPLILEARMTFIGGNSYRAVFTIPAGINLDGRRLSIQTDEGGAYNVFVQ